MAVPGTVPPNYMSGKRNVGVWVLFSPHYLLNFDLLNFDYWHSYGGDQFHGVTLPQLPAGTCVSLRGWFDNPRLEPKLKWIVYRSDGKEIEILWPEGTPLETVITQIMMVVA